MLPTNYDDASGRADVGPELSCSTVWRQYFPKGLFNFDSTSSRQKLSQEQAEERLEYTGKLEWMLNSLIASGLLPGGKDQKSVIIDGFEPNILHEPRQVSNELGIASVAAHSPLQRTVVPDRVVAQKSEASGDRPRGGDLLLDIDRPEQFVPNTLLSAQGNPTTAEKRPPIAHRGSLGPLNIQKDATLDTSHMYEAYYIIPRSIPRFQKDGKLQLAPSIVDDYMIVLLDVAKDVVTDTDLRFALKQVQQSTSAKIFQHDTFPASVVDSISWLKDHRAHNSQQAHWDIVTGLKLHFIDDALATETSPRFAYLVILRGRTGPTDIPVDTARLSQDTINENESLGETRQFSQTPVEPETLLINSSALKPQESIESAVGLNYYRAQKAPAGKQTIIQLGRQAKREARASKGITRVVSRTVSRISDFFGFQLSSLSQSKHSDNDHEDGILCFSEATADSAQPQHDSTNDGTEGQSRPDGISHQAELDVIEAQMLVPLEPIELEERLRAGGDTLPYNQGADEVFREAARADAVRPIRANLGEPSSFTDAADLNNYFVSNKVADVGATPESTEPPLLQHMPRIWSDVPDPVMSGTGKAAAEAKKRGKGRKYMGFVDSKLLGMTTMMSPAHRPFSCKDKPLVAELEGYDDEVGSETSNEGLHISQQQAEDMMTAFLATFTSIQS